MKISFIMVNPAYPSNVGATARALKAMGFSRLVVVNPKADLTNERVRKLGKHADDVIDNIEIFDDLQSALQDVDIAIAASHRIRHVHQVALSSRELGAYLSDRSDMANHVAVVVGRESTGLNNSEVGLCDIVVQIPCANEQPSLNLAQAVMVLAYELSGLSIRLTDKQVRREARVVTQESYQSLKQQVADLLDQLGIVGDHPVKSKAVARLDALSAKDFFLVHEIKKLLSSRANQQR